MKQIKNYLITLVVGLVIAFLIILSEDVFTQTDKKELYESLCDAFFVPGVLIGGFGLLVFASNEGAFDMLTFGMRKFFSLFKKDLSAYRDETFYEYKMAREGSEKPMAFMLIVGLVLIAISMIFLIMYYQC